MCNSLKRNSEFHRLYLYFIKGKWWFSYRLLIVNLTNFWWGHAKAVKCCSGLCSGTDPFEIVFMRNVVSCSWQMFVEWEHKVTNAICSENIHHSFARHWTLCQTMKTLKMAKTEFIPDKMLTAYSGESMWTKYSLSLNRVLGEQEERCHSESGNTLEKKWSMSRAGIFPAPGMWSWDSCQSGYIYCCFCVSARAESEEGCGGVWKRGGVSPVVFADSWPVVQLAVWAASPSKRPPSSALFSVPCSCA